MVLRRVSMIGLVVGLVFVTLGGVAVLRAGVTPIVSGDLWSGLTSGHVSVAGLHQTRLMAGLELVYGLFLGLTGVGSVRGSGAETLRLLGAVGVAFGLGVLVFAPALHDELGVHRATGLLFMVAGGVALWVTTTVRRR